MADRARARRTGTGLVGCLLAMTGVIAAPPDTPSAIARAEERGLALARYDRAAWITTDDMLAKLPPARLPEVGGWIVTPRENGLHVDFVGKGDAADRAIYAADLDGKAIIRSTVFSADDAPHLSDPALRGRRALQVAGAELARHTDWRPCAKARFNTVVLPPAPDGTIPVYFLTPQTETASLPFGGHYEVDVAADGHIASARAFTRSCLTMAAPPTQSGATPAGLLVSHLLDPQPTEIHVFEQLQGRLPLFVMTGTKQVWRVEGGKITRAEELAK